MLKNKILNIAVILLGIATFIGIVFIIKKDIDKIEKHLQNCQKVCYPRNVLDEFSKNYCVCENINPDKSVLDK